MTHGSKFTKLKMLMYIYNKEEKVENSFKKIPPFNMKVRICTLLNQMWFFFLTQYHLPLKGWLSDKFYCQPMSRLTAGASEEGYDNAAKLAAHDGAHVMFIMPSHRSHKSCITPLACTRYT